MKYQLPIEVHGDHVHLDVTTLPPALRELVLNELVIDPLRKAGGGEGLDPRFPELARLVDRARATWNRWTGWLGSRLAQAVTHDDADLRARLATQSLDDFELGVVAATTGSTTSPEVTALVRRGDLEPTYATEAPIPTAVRLGLGLDPRVPHRVPAVPREVVPTAPTTAQEAAIAYARDRAAIYMRRPVAAVRTAAEAELLDTGVTLDRRLTSAERQAIADTIERSLRDQRPAAETARRLKDAVHGTSLTNDMERVAITELAFAHGWGGYVALKGRTAAGEDPQVYKIVSPAACADCRRIWGPAANPTLYRLSAVEAFTSAGGNFNRPRTAWGPTIGPTHPRCTCPPLLKWDAAVHDAVQDVAAELRSIYG